MQNEIYDTIIIGGGVTGFSAAMYAGRLKLRTLVIAAVRGGTIILTNDIANWPGIKQTDGITLAKNIEEHALSYEGVEAIDTKVTKVEKCPAKHGEAKGTYFVYTEDNKKYQTKTITFATGTEWRKLGVPGEKEFSGKGVHYCALCDGYAYKNKIVCVVGGADSAAKEAILLTQWAKKVYIIYRGDKIRPEPYNLARIENKIKEGKIEIITNTNITQIKGDKFVTHAVLDKPYNESKEFKLDGIFVDIGHIPQSQLAKSLGVALDNKGNIIIDRASQTNVVGIFAGGDVVDTKFKQAITGAAEGVLAAYSAYEYVNKETILTCEFEAPKKNIELGSKEEVIEKIKEKG
ncbi:FAD-dependent oxidoreductase [Candidatus Micrarchaeota archaeon]|nr:FAD-dependent oxidoreductase [Candidatus Micrarchaeota archaeon]